MDIIMSFYFILLLIVYISWKQKQIIYVLYLFIFFIQERTPLIAKELLRISDFIILIITGMFNTHLCLHISVFDKVDTISGLIFLFFMFTVKQTYRWMKHMQVWHWW